VRVPRAGTRHLEPQVRGRYLRAGGCRILRGALITSYHVCAALAVVILGISKTGFGGGIGILSIPLMAMVMPADQMIAVLAVLLVVVDLFANAHYLGEYDWPVLRWLIPGAVVGVAIGCAVLVAMRGGDPVTFNRKLSLTIGVLCLVFVLAQVWRMTGRELPTLPGSRGSSVAVGAVAGTVSTISHSAGPIVTLYLLQERVDKRRLVGTMLLYTLLINWIKLASYAYISTVTWQTVRDSAWMIPLLPLGTISGAWMNKRLPEKPFMAIMYLAAAATSVQMIYKAMV
jgi:uncharacterized membrane protein YfcA